jgi:RNA polymerase sigma-70 factor (ECF subfamily)
MILAAKNGCYDPSCVKALINDYGNMLYRICLCVLCDKDDAEDAVQETFLKFLTKAPQFESEEHKKAWLIRVATNISKNMCVLRIKHRTVDINELEYVGEADEDRGVFEAIMNLPVKFKIVMILHYIEGYPTKDIAEMVKISDDAVRKRLQKGRELLKLEMEKGNRDAF